jgi:protein-tyrosine phosphatase
LPSDERFLIDIHSHVLPGLDDGSRSFEESLAMLALAAEGGTTDIVATPHANPQFRFDPEAIAAKRAELSEALEASLGDRAPRIHTGCDFHLTFDNVDDALAHRAKYTVNGGRYLLVEFPDLLIYPKTAELFARLLDAGLVPIITHPERNDLLRHRLPDLKAWVELGCLIQVTAASFEGRFGRRAQAFSEKLMEEDLVHFIASDAHDTKHRPPGLRGAYDLIRRRWGAARADALFAENGRAVIENRYLPRSGEQVAASKPWYRFW